VAYVSSSATALPRIASVRCSPPSGFGAFADSSYRIFKPSHFKAGLRRHSYWLKVGSRISFRKHRHTDVQPAVFILFYGQVLRIFAAKWVMVIAIAIFEIGSLLCGVSQNVDQLIAGRTVSGAGAAGICGSSPFAFPIAYFV
jgi:hypothetical protein